MHDDAYTVMRDGIPDPIQPTEAPDPAGGVGRDAGRPATRGARPRRGTGRGRGRLLAAVAGLAAGSVLAGVGGAWASHQFSDVPADHPFHADIDWLVDHGIAEGYGDGTFKPTAAVSRQAAAAYLRRYNGEIETVKRTTNPAAASVFVSTVSCPADKRVVGGGGGSDVFTLALANSGPDLTSSAWTIRLVERNGATVNPAAVEVYALCVPR